MILAPLAIAHLEANTDQGASEGSAIMDHEPYNPTVLDSAQLLRSHTQELGVMRQEMTSCGQKQSESAGQDDAESGEHQQGMSIPNQGLEKTLLIMR